jgi:uncharacterized damage-inducible protein DinB
MMPRIGFVVLCAGILALLCGGFTIAAYGQGEAASSGKHWANAKQLTLAVAQAMPPEDYSFKPVPAEMSFGEQMMHLTAANYAYCSFVSGSKSPYQKPKEATKDQIVKDISHSFDSCAKTFNSVTDTQLDQKRGTGKNQADVRELMLGAMIHMAHHRGQAEVYLRLKGITPPEYQW